MMKKNLDALRIDKSKKGGPVGGRGFWIALSLTLLVLVVLLVHWNYSLTRMAATETAAADPVGAETAVEPEVQATDREVLIASGYVIAHHKHRLGSKVMGRVEWIGVEKGDLVRKGQLLVKLEDREYRAQLEQAKAALRLAEERLEELEAGSRPEEIQKARAELKRAQADRLNAELELKRLRELLDNGVVAPHEVDNARARFEMADATVEAADRVLQLLVLGPRRERIDQARAEVEHARAAVEYAQTMLDATEIRAPISGTVLQRIAEIGEMITTSFAGGQGAKSAVVALADLEDLQVELDISQTDFNRISPDNECEVTLEAFPDRMYPCAIDEISPEANRQKASIQVKVKILEPDEFLRPEMSARVRFLKKESSNE